MRKARNMRRAVVAVVVGGLIASACGGDDDGGSAASATTGGSAASTTTSGAEGGSAAPTTGAGEGGTGADECTQDRAGGEVTMATVSEPAGLDPVVNRGTGPTGGNEVNAIYDTLVRYDAETDEFVPVVAESLEPNADFTEWTLKLRDGVTFGNGDPLTADAVKASFARHQEPANRSANYLESLVVTEMTVVDPLTLVFHLDAPWSRFPSLLGHVAGMVTNPAVVESLGDQFNANPVGGGVGPYEVDHWTPGEELVLKAKTDWWGGPVCIQELRFIVVPGADATYDSFRNGEIQVAFLREAEVIAQARDDGAAGVSTIYNAGRGFILNHASGPAADPLVREALAAAIDPDLINERALGGKGRPTTAIIAEQSVHYDGLEGVQPDAARASELVAEAKAGGWDGRIDLLCQPDPTNQEICLAAKAMMDAAGMETTIDSKQVNDLISQVLTDHNFQMAAWSFPIADAEPWLRLSASVGTDGSLNPGGYSNPEMDAALDALRRAPDEASRKQTLAEIQDIWNETLPDLIFESNEVFIAVDDSVKGILPSQNAQIHFDKAYIAG